MKCAQSCSLFMFTINCKEKNLVTLVITDGFNIEVPVSAANEKLKSLYRSLASSKS